MPGVAHAIFVRMFAPTVVVGLWTYAQLESIRHRDFVAMWKEDRAVRVGNPYTASLPPDSPSTLDAEPQVADVSGDLTGDGDF